MLIWSFDTNVPNIGMAIKMPLSQWIYSANDDVMYSKSKH